MTSLSLAISPCPNDTLMFDGLVNNKIPVGQFSFEPEYHDIEQLNDGLMSGRWDIAKMSVAAYPLIQKDYVMLSAGMAMGFHNGPLILSADPDTDLDHFAGKMLIPGKHTTANLLLTRFFPSITNKEEALFSVILHRLAAHDAEAGLIIHESRFTYKKHRLHCLVDLGELWFGTTEQPLPLGAIVMRRSLGTEAIDAVEQSLRASVEYGLTHRQEAMAYIREHAQEMDALVIDSHIELYVNHFSINPGVEGRKAVLTLLHSLPENHSLSLQDIFSSWEN